jgi:hypothetical protein
VNACLEEHARARYLAHRGECSRKHETNPTVRGKKTRATARSNPRRQRPPLALRLSRRAVPTGGHVLIERSHFEGTAAARVGRDSLSARTPAPWVTQSVRAPPWLPISISSGAGADVDGANPLTDQPHVRPRRQLANKNTSHFSERAACQPQGERKSNSPRVPTSQGQSFTGQCDGDRCRTFGSTSLASNSSERRHASACST